MPSQSRETERVRFCRTCEHKSGKLKLRKIEYNDYHIDREFVGGM